MFGTFFGINTALRSLQTQQRSINTTAHNIANANTEGYSRQRVIMETTPAFPVPALNKPGGTGWQVGSGVNSQEIRRIRDMFLDNQIRHETGILGFWEQRQDILKQVEVVFNEPSSTGLSTLIGQFWDSWQELSKYAESSPVRTTVIETANALAQALNHSAAQLETIMSDIDQIIDLKVMEINSLAQQISDLNKQIKNIILAGDQPNDLLDRRDLLLDNLSKIVNFSVESNLVDVNGYLIPDGQIKVQVDGRYLVDIDVDNQSYVNRMETGDGGAGEDVWEVYWAGDALPRTAITFNNGEVKGLQNVRADVQGYLDKLDILARGLAENINAIHRQGYALGGQPVDSDGLPDTDPYENFFVAYSSPGGLGDISQVGINAKNIGVNMNLRNDVTKIAAADTDEAGGNGKNALEILQLRQKLFIESGGTLIEGAGGVTTDDYYKNFIARLGVEAYESTRMTTNQGVLLDQLTNRKESISGVSLDEEMVNMLQFQRAYEASARMITTLDSMIDKIINGMGITR